MSSARLAVAAVLMLATPALGRAQGLASVQARAARAIFLRDSLRAEEAAARGLSLQRARRGRSGPVLVVLRRSDDQQVADAVAAQVWQAFRQFEVFHDSDFASVALLDDAVGSSGVIVDGRRAVAFPRPGGSEGGLRAGADVVRQLADNAIWTIAEGLIRDSVAREWLERRLDPRTVDRDVNAGVVEELAIGQWSATRACLDGIGEACAIHLGVEDHPDMTLRFPVRDIRATLARSGYGRVGRLEDAGLVPRCMNGDDGACLEMYGPNVAPAGVGARRSFVLFLKNRYGPEAVRVMLNGPEPVLGARVSRATGSRPDVVAGQWRDWAVATGKRRPVEAGFRELSGAIMIVGALMALAMRSGRWRL